MEDFMFGLYGEEVLPQHDKREAKDFSEVCGEGVCLIIQLENSIIKAKLSRKRRLFGG